MKYAFIQRNRRVWPISVQCRVLRVSVSGYHEHLVRRRGILRRRHLSDEALLVHIRAVYAENRGAYGWPRIWRQLRAQGIGVGKQRVQRLMQQHGIRARGKRRFRIATTDSRHGLPIAPNLLDRNFTVAAPNQVWVGDITYIPSDEGWLFLAVVLDLFSRQVVGWSMRADMGGELVIDALDMAWLKRSPDSKAGAKTELIFHSDRGSQYASYDFARMLKECGITPSMSRKGNCWDNACSETLFGSLKVERLHGEHFDTLRQAKDEVLDWLLWYNQTRLHSTLNYVSPTQFERDWNRSTPAIAS
jgi:transposase InsO family protein